MAETATYRNALPLRSMLLEYRLEAVLGAGGFGMTYLGRDTHFEKHVAIKEYLPIGLAVRALDGSVVPITTELQYNYQWGLERFLLEARTLARFSHPHIVRVNRYFEANATGYMVMDYEKGESLSQALKHAPQPDEAKLKGILMPLLDGLQAVHEAGFLHRDIKPGNIFLREAGSPVLIDFGAARQAIGGATRSLTSVLTPGYAPLEQYSSDGHQGPWSDIYAMAGVLYRALLNDTPPDAVSRLKEDTVPGKLATLRGRASEDFLRAVEWALRLDERQRPQNVIEWKRALAGEAVASAPARLAAHSAPTARSDAKTVAVAPAQPLAKAQQAEQEPRRSSPRQPPERPGSGWRWVGVGLALLAAVIVAGAWNKQRQAKEQARLEAAQLEAGRRAKEEKRTRFAQAAPGVPETPGRERPPRERGERPGEADVQETRRRAEADFRSADRNGDGYLAREEVRGRMPFVEKEFNRIDADGDGRLSPQEFMRFRRAVAQRSNK